MLELKHISKQFQERIILDDLSMTFQDTGFIGIKGDSGCGKSTLLYIIGMLDQNYTGEILYNNEMIEDKESFIREHISYMMQNKDIIEALNVKENILLSCLVSEKKYSRAYFDKIVHQLGIQDLLTRYPSELSGGQIKRVSIAKALLKQSDIILCDEPTGALHENQAHEVMELLQKISNDALVIIVSHDNALLKMYCDHVLTMEHGKLKGRIKKRESCEWSKSKKKRSLLWFYPMKQCVHQKYKLVFLFIFQWIVIVTFFLIVTALSGVFISITESEKKAVDKNIMLIEKKDGQSFVNMISNPLIREADFSYHTEQIQLKNADHFMNAVIDFLPYDTSHIILKEGRLPQNQNELLISSSLQDEFKKQSKIQLICQEMTQSMTVVGVLQDDFFMKDVVYCHKNLKDRISFLKDDYTLCIEAKENDARQLYEQLQKMYFVYSEAIERVDNYQSLLKLAKGVALIFIGISFLVSLFLIGIVESIIYLERKHDTAYLMSLGLSKYKFLFLTLSEAVLLGLIMAVGGCVFSAIVYYFMNEVFILKNHFYFNLCLQPIFYSKYDLYILMILSYLIMAVIGVILPMRKMLKEDIIDVLREE